MLNTLIAIDDQIKINRLSSVLVSEHDLDYVFFSSSLEAVEYASNLENDIDIAVISIKMSILNGVELAEVIADRNFKCRFIFIFDEDTLSDVIGAYNLYDNCMLMHMEYVEPEGIRYLIESVKDEIISERKYESNLKFFKEAETIKRQKLNQLSEIVMSRIDGYKTTVDFYSESVRLLTKNDSECVDVLPLDFVSMNLKKYINIFLNETSDVNSLFKCITDKYNEPERKKLFLFNKCNEITHEEVLYTIYFIISFVCEVYLCNLSAYKAKIDSSIDSNYYKIDILMDTRVGYSDINKVKFLSNIVDSIIDTLSDKFEKASKGGIVQYRVCFDRSKYDNFGAI